MQAIEKQDMLKQGEYFITREHRRIYTVLGSCVAVTLFCPRTGDAAICHGMLSRVNGDTGAAGAAAQPGRYLAEVLPLLIAHFRKQGCLPPEIEVKLFGGASLMQRGAPRSSDLEVGLENVATALEILLGNGLRLRASNTGGALAHRIIFDTGSGEVLHQFLRNSPLKPFESP